MYVLNPSSPSFSNLSAVIGNDSYSGKFTDWLVEHIKNLDSKPQKKRALEESTPTSPDSGKENHENAKKIQKIEWDLPEEPSRKERAPKYPDLRASLRESRAQKFETSVPDTSELDVEVITYSTEPSVPPAVKAQVCRFWPNCTRGAACQFAHPEVAPVVECKFGANCMRPDCKFSHPSPAVMAAKTGVKPVTSYSINNVASSVPCRFWPKCMNPACPYQHPETSSGQATPNTIPCRFNASCTRPNCPFLHTQKPAGSTNERKFVLEDTEVERIVVSETIGLNQLKDEEVLKSHSVTAVAENQGSEVILKKK